MEFKILYGKKIQIYTVDREYYFGIVDECFDAEDNESGEESFLLRCKDGSLVEFSEEDIVEIREILT